jgi:sulfite reductase alpha subunit-like flavoprotein
MALRAKQQTIYSHKSKCSDSKCDCPEFQDTGMNMCKCMHSNIQHIDLTIDRPHYIFVLYGSGDESTGPHGSTHAMAMEMIDTMTKMNIGPILFSSLDDMIGVDIMKRGKLLLIATSTRGKGENPYSAHYWTRNKEVPKSYGNIPYIIWAIGDSEYHHHYAFGEQVRKRLEKNNFEKNLSRDYPLGMIVLDVAREENIESSKKSICDLLIKYEKTLQLQE